MDEPWKPCPERAAASLIQIMKTMAFCLNFPTQKVGLYDISYERFVLGVRATSIK